MLQCSLNEIPDNLGPPEKPKQKSPLKILRQQASLTQAELARRLSNTGRKLIPEQIIHDWEEGEYQPELSIPQSRALCQALGVSLDELADYLDPSLPSPLQQEEQES